MNESVDFFEQNEGQLNRPADMLEDLLPAYALGAADAGEIAMVHRSLASDPAAARTLVAYEALSEALLFGAPPVAPPAALGERLRAALDALVTAVALPRRTPPARTHRWHWPQLAAVAAVAAVIALVLLDTFFLREIDALHSQQALLRDHLTLQNALLTAQASQLDTQVQRFGTQDELLADLVANSGEHYTMVATQPDSKAVAKIAWLPDSHLAILHADAFPPLAPNQVYQLWLIRHEERTSGGVFRITDSGSGTFVFTPPESLENFEGMGITPEPAGGSLGPTAPPIVAVRL